MEKDPPQLLRMWPELDRPLQKVGKMEVSSLSSACISACIEESESVFPVCCIFVLWFVGRSKQALDCYLLLLGENRKQAFCFGDKKVLLVRGGGRIRISSVSDRKGSLLLNNHDMKLRGVSYGWR